jgi:hypothetical protein
MKGKGKGLFFMKSIHRTELDGPLQGAARREEPFEPTPEHPMIISASEVSQFLRCRLQWNWDKRVGLKSTKVGGPRVNGILVHAGKEEFYQLARAERTPENMKTAAKRAFKKITEVPVTSKDRELAEAMLNGYTRWVRGKHEMSDKSIGKRRVFPEWFWTLPLNADRSIWIRGKIDELFEPTIYKRVLAMDETKTKNYISFDMMDMDAQLTTYLWAMWKASTTDACPLPKPLRHRRYDRFIAYRTVLRRQMPGPRVKAALFAREPIERTPDELKMWERDTLRVVHDMLDAAIYPTRRESCRYECDFYELCLARGNKHDLKAMIKEQYTVTPSNRSSK